MRRTLFLFALAVMILVGCAAIAPNLPAITDSPSAQQADGRIVWHDLLTTTPEASRSFYGELFGWQFERPAQATGIGGDDSYMLIRHNGRLIGGMLDARVIDPDENLSQWITVLSVADIEAAVGHVTGNGGEVLTPPTDVGARGIMAVIAGPDKGLIALLQARGGVPAEHEPETNGWLWDELWTNDVERATEFYGGLAGFDVEDHDVPGAEYVYRVLRTDGTPRAAIIPNPFDGQMPVWVNYLRVEDPAAITARVESLGGRILVDASDRPIGGQVAFVAGPSGAGVALQTWPPEAEEAK